MRFKTIIRVVTVLLVVILKMLSGADEMTHTEQTVSNLVTQISLTVLELSDRFRPLGA